MKTLSSAILALGGVTIASALANPGVATATASAPASKPLACLASMSNNHPRDYTQTDVLVSTVGYAKVITVAHYKTVNREHTGTANAKGRASIAYYISGATPGYKVVVRVTVTSGRRSGNCSTWFVPHR